MKITNLTDRQREIGVTGQVAGPGETIEIDDDELGRSLLEQPDRWAPAGPTNVDTSIPGVLAQVRDDKGRARTALDREQESEKPRKSLIDALSKIIDAQEGDQS